MQPSPKIDSIILSSDQKKNMIEKLCAFFHENDWHPVAVYTVLRMISDSLEAQYNINPPTTIIEEAKDGTESNS